MRKLIYVKLEKNQVVCRIVGDTHDQVFPTSALSHPRTMAGEFDDLVKLFDNILEYYYTWPDMFFRPKLLIHFVEKVNGGYTSSERLIMKKASEEAGSALTWLLADEHGPLSDEDINGIRKLL